MKINTRESPHKIFTTSRPLFASIRGRLYLLLFSVLIPVMLVQGGYIYVRFKARVESASRANMEISRAVATTFNAFVKDILHQEAAISANLTMPQTVSEVEMNRILGLNKAEFPAVHSFMWLDPHGRVIASNLGSAVGLNLIDRDYVRELMSGKEWVVGPLILSRVTGKPVFTVSRAIRANGNLLGMVVAAVNPEKLGDIIFVHLAKDEAITILDSRGMAVYQQPPREWNWEERNLIKARPAIGQALKGKEVSGFFPCDKTGKDNLVAIVPIASIGWAASVGRSREAVMAPIRAQLLQEAVIFSLIMAGVFLGAFILSEGISRSLRRLLEHASALGRGDLKEPIEESGPAELRGLASAFNAMTERVGAREKALKASQERLVSVLEAIPASVYIQASDCSIRFVNRTFRETFGAPEGKYCYELLRGRSEPCENCDVLCVINTQSPRQWEWTDPGGKCYSIHTHPFTDSDGSPQVLKLAVDISERKRAWQAFLESENRYRELVQNANSAIIRLNGDGAITFFNEYAQSFFGYSEDEVIGKHVGILLPEKESDGTDLTMLVQDVASHPERYSNNINENIRRDGSRVWMAWTNKPMLDENGKVAGILSVGTDITQRKKAEDALRENQKMLAADLDAMTRLHKMGTLFAHEGNLSAVLSEILDAAIAISEADFGNIQLLAPGSLDLKILAQRGFPDYWLDFWDNVSKGQGVCGTALERGERIIVEDVEKSPLFSGAPALQIHLRAGVRAVQSTPLFSRSGRVLGMFSTHYRVPHRSDERALRLLDMLARHAADIIEKMQADEALRESRAKLEAALYSMSDALFISDTGGRFIDFNDAFATFHRFRNKEECFKTLAEYPDILEVFMENGEPAPLDQWAIPRALRGEMVSNAEYALRRKDTGETWVGSFSFAPIRDQSGVIVGAVVVGRDVTNRKQAENALRESEQQLRRLSAKLFSAHEEERKRIAAELHDSFGSSLAAIKIGIENGRDRLGEAGPGLLDAPIAWTQLLIDEVRRFMTELRPPLLDDMGVIAALQWFFSQYRITYPAIHIEPEVLIEEQDIPEPLRIVIFRIAQEAFHNIAKYSKAEYVDFSLIDQDGAIKLTIEDNGVGFDLETVLSKTGERQGLGLASMKERAEQSGASFTIRSVPGTGTVVSAKWPLAFLRIN
ncbi:MAG: PAS domain S-box protein [Syntrophobacteraceae bacterium]|nr:PAS domain S-box protein [Syntrophobacteraceae bacterium]